MKKLIVLIALSLLAPLAQADDTFCRTVANLAHLFTQQRDRGENLHHVHEGLYKTEMSTEMRDITLVLAEAIFYTPIFQNKSPREIAFLAHKTCVSHQQSK